VHRGLANTAARVERLLAHRLDAHCLTPVAPLTVETSSPSFEPGGSPGDMTAVTLPHAWGPPWHTTWFHLSGVVPTTWAGRQVVAFVDLGFRGQGDGFQAEGLVWQDGRLRHGLQPDRRTVIVADPAMGGEVIDLWIEAASNPIMADDPSDQSYRPTVMGDPSTTPDQPLYVMRRAELAVVQAEVMALRRELHMVADVLADMSPGDASAAPLERVLEDVIAAVDLDDVVASAVTARAVLAPVLARRGVPERHRVTAVGHAHLDTAWLWPVREARRKARRTFANAVDLAERHPDYRFAHSQARHWAWVAQDDPELFARMRQQVEAGRLEPVGGMWVEADLNLSGGESLVRQLLYGQHAFHTWFGRWCRVGFLPDDFGYPATLPQLLAKAGCSSFFTQKLSWNETNRFPHHTFWWEGLDGSRVLTHFSPVETYNALMMPGQLRFGVRNFADHGVSDRSLMCFGHGDGGGGPTAEMLQRAYVLQDWEHVPLVEMGTVEGFFDDVTHTLERADTWVGEIVLEKHRGTFTSQLGTKQGNVRAEMGLRAAEWWTVATGQPAAPALRDLWREVLVQQFHDILPGSSIAWVHRDAEQVFREVSAAVEGWIDASLGVAEALGWCVANSAGVDLDGIIVMRGVAGGEPGAPVQVLHDGTWAARVRVPALASAPWSQVLASPAGQVTAGATGEGGAWMDNGIVRLQIDSQGRITEVMHHGEGPVRRVLRRGTPGGRLVLHADQPAEYDAWDIDQPDARKTPQELSPATDVQVVEVGPLLARVRCSHAWRGTTLVHDITLTADTTRVDHRVQVDWHESERRLSFVLPVEVAGTRAVAGVQFGHVERPRHTNTSWQAAHFEQVAHRFVHVLERRFGVALLFSGPRGVDVNHPERHLGLSLLRSSRYPDPTADRGEHCVQWSWMITNGEVFDLEAEAQRLQCEPRLVARSLEALVRHDLEGVMVDTLKAPHVDDDTDDVILRLWESAGARSSGTLQLTLPGRTVVEAAVCDLLERTQHDVSLHDDGSVPITMGPFEVVTLRLRAPADPQAQ